MRAVWPSASADTLVPEAEPAQVVQERLAELPLLDNAADAPEQAGVEAADDAASGGVPGVEVGEGSSAAAGEGEVGEGSEAGTHARTSTSSSRDSANGASCCGCH